jgi:hypothetical protein
MFDTQCGWLRYRPFHRYELPTPYYALSSGDPDNPDTGPFVDRRTGKTLFTRKLWALTWPGETERAHQAMIPASIVQRWPNWKPDPRADQSHYSIGRILERGWLPPDNMIPETIAYHLAINYKNLALDAVPYPVCGLPAARVQQVIDARFAIDGTAHAALQYLKWMAEGHRDHPLLRCFDTNIRDTLGGLNHEAVRLYFYLLYDYLYDAESKWWSRDGRSTQQAVAIYLHWVGRTGGGLYESLSGLRGRTLEDAPDVKAQLERWDMWSMRDKMHEDGDPCQGEAVGPSLGDEE